MNLWNKQYQFDRDYFCKAFEILAPSYYNYLCTVGEWYEGDEFMSFKIKDEVYLIQLETGIIINWYKHLGRCNMTNYDMTKEEFENFLKKLEEDCRGVI